MAASAVKVISSNRFFQSSPVLEPALADRVDTLIRSFSMTRARVFTHDRSSKLRYGDRSPTGQVNKYLNKLTRANFIVVSHGVFRLMQEDSSVSIATIFDCIMQYAFRYPSNADLYARMCSDLASLYPALPDHIETKIRSVHEKLHGRKEKLVTESYASYVEDVTQRREACGCFVFVSHLYNVDVVGASLLSNQWALLCDTIRQSIRTVLAVSGTDDTSTGNRALCKPHLLLLEPYIDCLSSSLNESSVHRLLQSTTFGPALCSKVRSIFDVPGIDMRRKKRNPTFPGKIWFGLVELHDIYMRDIQPVSHMIR